MESGLSHKDDFEHDQYKAVTQVVNPDTIIVALERIYSDLIFVEQYPEFNDNPSELKTAQQFVWLHRNPQKASEETGEKEFESDEDND